MSVRSVPCFSRICFFAPGRSGGGGLLALMHQHKPGCTQCERCWRVSQRSGCHTKSTFCALQGEWPGNTRNPSNGCLRNATRHAQHYRFYLLGFLLAHSAWPTEYVNVPEACRAFCETAGTKLRRVSPSVSLEQLAGLPVPQMEDCQPQRDVDLEIPGSSDPFRKTLGFGSVFEHFVFSAQGRQSSR